MFLQNSDYHRSDLVLSIQLITLIPREGTETQHTRHYPSFPLHVDYPYSPRGDGNAASIPYRQRRDRVDYPYSPRGDGNYSKVQIESMNL